MHLIALRSQATLAWACWRQRARCAIRAHFHDFRTRLRGLLPRFGGGRRPLAVFADREVGGARQRIWGYWFHHRDATESPVRVRYQEGRRSQGVTVPTT